MLGTAMNSSSHFLVLFVSCICLLFGFCCADLNNDHPVRLYSQWSSDLASLTHAVRHNKFQDESVNLEYVRDIFVQLFQNKLRVDNDATNKCLSDLNYVALGLMAKKSYSLSMIDSAGKIEPCWLLGNRVFVGSYHQCTSISATVNGTSFVGQFIFVTVAPPATIADATLYTKLMIISLCVPDSCSTDQLNAFLGPNVYKLTAGKLVAYVTTPSRRSEFTVAAYSSVVILSVLLFVVTVGTFWDYFGDVSDWFNFSGDKEVADLQSLTQNMETDQNEAPESDLPEHEIKESKALQTIKAVMMSFSALQNGSKILHVSPETVGMTSLHGIRFLSMAWVILGHTYAFSVNFMKNPYDLANFSEKSILFQILVNGLSSVDTFFLLSGCLTAYTFMLKIAARPDLLSSGKFWALFYFHRFWRLTPAYILILRVYVGLFPYIGSGPLWSRDGIEHNQCDNSWWTNLLYINNLYGGPEYNTTAGMQTQSCMGWTWYLANDMQFFVLSPLILYPLARSDSKLWKIVGVSAAVLLLLASMISTGMITLVNNFPANIISPDLKQGDIMNKLYIKPWCRIGPYIVGLGLGYVLSIRKQFTRLKFPMVSLGWVLSLTLCSLVIFGLYPEFHNLQFHYSVQVRAFYEACSRTAWGCGVAWVIFACVDGYGGPAAKFLSWSFWVPLSRLTYCAYLIHPVVIFFYYLSLNDTLFFTNFVMICLFLSFLVISFTLAFVLSIVFEAPFIALEKIMLPSRL